MIDPSSTGRQTRRDVLTTGGAAALCLAGGPGLCQAAASSEPLFRISLAQWSLHRMLRGDDWAHRRAQFTSWQGFLTALRDDDRSLLRGPLNALEFAPFARRQFGIDAVEYVNQFFFGKASDQAYLREMKRRADGEGVRSLLIMCDLEGDLGDPDTAARTRAAQNHFKWVEAAAYLGCHAIRVNATSRGSWSEQARLAADGLRQLAEFGHGYDMDIVVENHGGLTSNPEWLTEVMTLADHGRLGTLPDFGNFKISETETYHPIQGVRQLMPFARAVSAKSYDFSPADGTETTLDYFALMKAVLDAGYRGYVGIEYEGDRLSEVDGVRATKALLENIRTKLASRYPPAP